MPTLNPLGRGPAYAIRYGIEQATAPVVVVSMADGSDDPTQVDLLARLVERGVVVAAASRYMPGGAQIGGPFLKTTLPSRLFSLFGDVLADGRGSGNNDKDNDPDQIEDVYRKKWQV